LSKRAADLSGSFSIIVLQKTAQPFIHQYYSGSFPRRFENRPISKGLMGTFLMIIRTELASQQFQVGLRADHKVVQTLLLDGSVKPLAEGVQVRALGWKLHRSHACGRQRLFELLPEDGVPIMDQPAAFRQKPIFAILHVSYDLDQKSDLLSAELVRIVPFGAPNPQVQRSQAAQNGNMQSAGDRPDRHLLRA